MTTDLLSTSSASAHHDHGHQQPHRQQQQHQLHLNGNFSIAEVQHHLHSLPSPTTGTAVHSSTSSSPLAMNSSSAAAHRTTPAGTPAAEEDDDSSGSHNTRNVGSCETCKVRKVRCDRARPACTWCQKNNAECVYRTKKKPGLKPGFGKELFARMGALEQELASHSRLIETLIHEVDYWKKQQSLQPSTAPSIPQGAYVDDGISASSNNPTSAVMGTFSHAHPKNPRLPGPMLVRELIYIYFTVIHPQFPILHPARTTARLNMFMDRGLEEPWPMLLHALCAISLRCMSSEKLGKEREVFYEYCKQQVVLESLDINSIEKLQALTVLAVNMLGTSNGPQTWSIVALICSSAVHLRLSREPVNARKRQRPGCEELPRTEDILPPTSDPIEIESRRRLFWGIYIVDRYSAVATAFPCRIKDSDIDRLLPVRDDLWSYGSGEEIPITRWLKTPARTNYSIENPNLIDHFGRLAELLQIVGQVHEFLMEPISVDSAENVEKWRSRHSELENLLTSWWQALPDNYKLTDSFITDHTWCRMRVMIYLTYRTATIRLHASAGYSTINSKYFTTSKNSADKCVHAAKEIAELTCRVSSQSGFSSFSIACMGAHYAWSIWVAARLFLVDCLVNEKPFPPEFLTMLAQIKSLGKPWRVSARYAEILETVMQEELASRKRAEEAAGSDAGPTDKTKLLNGARRNAYALEFLLSNNEPKVEAHQLISPVIKSPPPEDVSLVLEWFNLPRPVNEPDQPIESLNDYKNIVTRQEHGEW